MRMFRLIHIYLMFSITAKLVRKYSLESIFDEGKLLWEAFYGKEIDKFEFRMKKASNHTSKSTAAYLSKKGSETGRKCIPFNKIPVKSSEASPIDICASGLLKRALKIRYPRTLDGL